MRPIKFRGFHQSSTGKSRAFISGKWLSGDWVTSHVFATHQIGKGEGAGIVWLLTHIDEQNTDNINTYEVIPETVGQIISEHDDNFKDVYEWDIVNVRQDGEEGIGIIAEEHGAFVVYSLSPNIYEAKIWDYWYNDWSIKVIGNKFENPELLREAGKDGAQSAAQDVLAPAT